MASFQFVPLLRGQYLNYQQYLALIGTLAFFLIGLILQLVSLCLKGKKIGKTLFWIGSFLEAIAPAVLYGLHQIPGIVSVALSIIILVTCQNIITPPTPPPTSSHDAVAYQSANQHDDEASTRANVSLNTLGAHFIAPDQAQTQTHQQYYILQQAQNGTLPAALQVPLPRDNTPAVIRREKSIRAIKKSFIIFAVAIAYLLKDTCVCFFHKDVGISILGGEMSISTGFLRYFQLKAQCPPGPPCHVYATLPEDSNAYVFINIHTHSSITDLQFTYGKQAADGSAPSELNALPVQYFNFVPDYVEAKGERLVHTVLLGPLTAATKYYFAVQYNGKVQYQSVYKTPGAWRAGDSASNVTFVNGGDEGNNAAARALFSIMPAYQPDVIFVGGDIAYDNAIPSCYYTWDQILSTLQATTTKLGYLIPVVHGMGNHDIGVNPMSGKKQAITSAGPFFYVYFPQHFNYNRTTGATIVGVPPVGYRKSHFYHKFGDLLFFSLDVGYVDEIRGAQVSWMNNTIYQYACQDKCLKMAHYHQPIYYSTKDSDSDKTPFQEQIFAWQPFFDEQHFITVFENHRHTLKRTKPLRGNNENPDGTVYLGDGALGALRPKANTPYTELFDTLLAENHFWVSQIASQQVYHRAISTNSTVLDSTVQQTYRYLNTGGPDSHAL